MTLDNETLLGSYLAHIQANVRELTSLDFERAYHPDNNAQPIPMSPARVAMRDEWELLRKQLGELLQLSLKPFGQLVESGACYTDPSEPRCWRWNMGAIKKLADKRRRKHPEFNMMRSWDYEAKRRLPAG